MNHELIAVIANLSLALSFIVGLVFGISQVRAAARDRRERLTIETLRTYSTRTFVDMVLYINSDSMPSDYNGWVNLPVHERAILFQYSQEMESLGILVAENIINLDLVDKTLGSLVTTTWKKFENIFLDLRERTPDPFLGEYYQWLAEKIERRMNEHPRKPFHLSHH